MISYKQEWNVGRTRVKQNPQRHMNATQQFHTPGPFAPPGRSRPKRKMTALSYSCTICRENKSNISTTQPGPNTGFYSGSMRLGYDGILKN